MRIRNIFSHLIDSPKDVSNQRSLRNLLSKRIKVLRYLKTQSLDRYSACLERIGVEPRAVEGEQVINTQDMRTRMRAGAL